MSTQAWADGALGKAKRATPQVIFGQVREDAEVELAAAAQAPGNDRWFAIASGGCTALSLLLRQPKRLDAIDINAAQIHLLELKRQILDEDSFEEIRDAFERDGCAALERHLSRLPAEAAAFWSHNGESVRHGLLHCGLFDRKLPLAMMLFRLAVHGRRKIELLLNQRELLEQRRFVKQRWSTWRWRFAIWLALNPALLRLVYGRAFTDRIPRDAGRQVRESFEESLLNSPAATNGYLWQMLAQRYPSNTRARPLYLREKMPPHTLAALCLHHAEATEWLAAQDARSIQFFALSNILELAPSDLAKRLAAAVVRTAVPGALVVTRAIFPSHSPSLSHPQLTEDSELGNALRKLDRTPVCRGLRVFRVAG